MLRAIALLLGTLRSGCRSRTDLLFENLALRQQLAVFVQSGRRPRIATADRWLWIVLRRLWSRWSDVLIFVQPETVIRWHRAGFRRYWTWRSHRRRRGRPPVDGEVRALIRRMAKENPTWGAPRIHSELRLLGFAGSERTVSRYLPRRPSPPDAFQRWATFLRNHKDAIAAMDFFVVPTVSFRVLYVWFAIEHGRRRILHFDVTDRPGAAWVVQQLRETFPFETARRYLIFDRDTIFSARVVAAVQSFGIEPTRTRFRSPWQNGIAERWIGSVRRELIGQVVVCNERHLRRLLRDYVAYYHEDRTHLGLEKGTAAERPVTRRPEGDARVVALPRVGGLHHRYEWRAAA
ncbi:MAG: integrase core domain-containing protein [Candidatus Binatia bacterium]